MFVHPTFSASFFFFFGLPFELCSLDGVAFGFNFNR
jgi:hypothetical protein